MKLHRTNRARNAGFSLAELMVVIVIIGLLVGVVAPNVFGYLFRGQEAAVKIDLTTIGQAVETYQLNNGGRAPESLDELIQPDPSSGEPYLKGSKIPTDPWSNEYQYEPPSNGEGFRLYSLGEDGQIGGIEKARDLTYAWAQGIEEDQ